MKNTPKNTAWGRMRIYGITFFVLKKTSSMNVPSGKTSPEGT
jgi:hypothetical protein